MEETLIWQTARHAIDLAEPRVMGIVNVTPDSFSDGGRYEGTGAALAHCEALLQQGADLLDIGGESTRPGAAPLAWQDEWRRVEPVLRGALGLGCPVSIDTMKPELMRRAADLGCDIVNDVNALRSPGAIEAVAGSACGACLMHMRGEPRSMQGDTRYRDVVAEVAAFLEERAAVLRERGVAARRIVVDPGIGFGKSVEANVELLRRQRELLALGYPLLVGWSRKSSLGAVTGRAAGERVVASVAAALTAVAQGARIVRVHDVAETVDALRVWKAAGSPATAAA